MIFWKKRWKINLKKLYEEMDICIVIGIFCSYLKDLVKFERCIIWGSFIKNVI